MCGSYFPMMDSFEEILIQLFGICEAFFLLAENSSALNNNNIVSCTFCGCNNCFSQLQHQVLLSISDIRQAHSGKRA